MKKLLSNMNFRIWLSLVGTATILIGTSYVMVQQSTRLAANDLPLAKAQQVKQQLEDGTNASDIVPTATIDLESDINVFVIVTDKNQHILAGSAKLGAQVPLPPSGVFAYTTEHGSDHFTWQPSSGVRLATEALSYNDGFVIAGQSLKPAEDRIDVYGELAFVGWLLALGWLSIVLLYKTR